MIGILDCDMTSFGWLVFLSFLVLRACSSSCFLKCTNCSLTNVVSPIYMLCLFCM
jgi:hypothetical protein